MAITAPRKINSQEDIRDEADLEIFELERTNQQEALEKQAFFAAQEENEARTQAMDTQQMVAQAQFAAIQNKDQQEKQQEIGNTLSWGWFAFALFVAVLLDAGSAFINVVPFIGGMISSFAIAPLGYGALAFIHKLGGVKFNKRILGSAATGFIIELIPYANALPGFTISVLMAKFLPEAKKRIDNIPVIGSATQKIDV